MPDKHAMLGPSAAHRWLECPPSAMLELDFPNTSSSYAEEGTKAHSLAERRLKAMIAGEDLAVAFVEYDDEMRECTEGYRDFVEEEYNAALAQTKDARLLVEQELEFAEYVPGGFGTSDSVIVSDTFLEVIDFKYGKGVAVDAKDNPQLRLYALGAYLKLSVLYDFDTVKMVIYQPRLHSITTDEISAVELLKWAEEYVKPRAAMAAKGEGEFKTGDHCRFCRASTVCRKRAEEAFKVIEAAEKNNYEVLADDEVDAILGKLSDTSAWIESMMAYAESKAVKGERKWTGFKLVESVTRRKIMDPIEAADRLTNAGCSEEDITNKTLKGITDLEKLVGKKMFNALVGDLVEKPKGKAVLAKITDKRKEITPAELAFKED